MDDPPAKNTRSRLPTPSQNLQFFENDFQSHLLTTPDRHSFQSGYGIPAGSSTGVLENSIFFPSRNLSRSPPTPYQGATFGFSGTPTPSSPHLTQSQDKTVLTAPPQTREASQLALAPIQVGLAIYKNYNPRNPNEENVTRTMNQTIGDAAANQRAPTTPKFVSPSSFDPVQTNPAIFLRSYDRCALANNWDDAHKINFLPHFLEGAANIWYTAYVADANNAQKTWNDVKRDFFTHFGGDAALKSSKLKFQTRRQGVGEDIKSFYYDLIVLANDYQPNMTTDAFRDQLELGLHPNYFELYDLLSQPRMTKTELNATIMKISALKERQELARLSEHMSLVTLASSKPPAQRAEIPNNTERSNVVPQSLRVPPREFRGPPRNRQELNNQPRYSFPKSRARDGRVICYKCGRYGHYASACRTLPHATRQFNEQRSSRFINVGQSDPISHNSSYFQRATGSDCRNYAQRPRTFYGQSQQNRGTSYNNTNGSRANYNSRNPNF